jgi:1-acyl-sn-glycerol-3-phosphate acyltransferase
MADALDVLRTVRVVLTDVAPMLLALGSARRDESTTTTPAGLPVVQARMRRVLARLGIALEVRHEDRVPRDGGLVFMWNQESHLDHLVLGAAIPRPFFSLYNNAVARFPFYGEHMRRTGHVHVDKNDEAQWRPSIARAAERVSLGECVLVSPEGTRSREGELLPMKRGAFILAAASTRPIVCTTVIGGHARLPRGSSVVTAGPVRVVFSQPIANDGDQQALAARVAATFEETKRAHAL